MLLPGHQRSRSGWGNGSICSLKPHEELFPRLCFKVCVCHKDKTNDVGMFWIWLLGQASRALHALLSTFAESERAFNLLCLALSSKRAVVGKAAVIGRTSTKLLSLIPCSPLDCIECVWGQLRSTSVPLKCRPCYKVHWQGAFKLDREGESCVADC